MKAPSIAFLRKKMVWMFLLPLAGIGLFLLRPSHKVHGKRDLSSLITAPVKVGEFVEEIAGSGEVESSSNMIVRCEVRTFSAGVAILQVVDEGTYVRKGDFLMRLDDSSLQLRLVVRQMDVNTSKAELAQAKADLEGAKLALEEFKSGTYPQQEREIQGKVFVAEEELRRSEEYLSYSEELAEKGYVSQVQLEADRFAVQKAKKTLSVAKTKLDVYRTYSREKALNGLQAGIETAAARLSTAERTHAVKLSRLEDIEEQLKKCTIIAPTSGQVVYAKNPAPGTEPLIEEGKVVREMQDLIYLPDPKRMQVTAPVNESRIDRIREGMPVRIKIEALSDLQLTGTLTKAGELPMPRTSAYTAYIKNYPVTIDIHEPPDSLRSGMTAEIAILVKKQDNAMTVPVHAVVERKSRFFCLVSHPEENRLEPREIQVGGANDQVLLVETGLSESETVVLGPDSYMDDAALPAPSGLAQRKKKKEPVVVKHK
jgi:HlyD family secretion protein